MHARSGPGAQRPKEEINIEKLKKINKNLEAEIKERKRIEAEIKKSLLEKDVLLYEIHHRVKNNLQVISSLLNLQANKIQSKEQALTAFGECRDRIFAMALVHEMLYQTGDISSINMKSYIDDITQELVNAYGDPDRISLNIDMENISLEINTAIPCGLILNEVITNSLKHAFPNKIRGCINVSFRVTDDDKYQLSINDNGIGLPEDQEVQAAGMLGLELVKILTRQIDGVIDIVRNRGTKITITFPKSEVEDGKT